MVIWKSIQGTSIKGSTYFSPPALGHDENVIEQIQNMPKGRQMSLEAADVLYWDIIGDAMEAEQYDISGSLINMGLVQWAVHNGIQIILNGSEYEICGAA